MPGNDSYLVDARDQSAHDLLCLRHMRGVHIVGRLHGCENGIKGCTHVHHAVPRCSCWSWHLLLQRCELVLQTRLLEGRLVARIASVGNDALTIGETLLGARKRGFARVDLHPNRLRTRYGVLGDSDLLHHLVAQLLEFLADREIIE